MRKTDHLISACPTNDPVCNNCRGPHLPTSILCPIKQRETNKQTLNYKRALLSKSPRRYESFDSDSDSESRRPRPNPPKQSSKTSRQIHKDNQNISLNVEQITAIITQVVAQILTQLQIYPPNPSNLQQCVDTSITTVINDDRH